MTLMNPKRGKIRLVSPQQDGEGEDYGSPEVEVSAGVRDLDWTILMARAQDGDAEAYRRLLSEITPYLRYLASKRHRDPRDVEDSVQDVLLTIHTIRQTYDPSRPFGPWLVAIANRRIFDRLRRQIRESHREEPLESEDHAFAEGAVNLEAMSDKELLEGAIDQLPPSQKQAIQLIKLKELSLKEASSESGISIASLKVATHRAVKSLRKILGEGRES